MHILDINSEAPPLRSRLTVLLPPFLPWIEFSNMKRYQTLLCPIILGLCAWGAGLGYCVKGGTCGKSTQDVVQILPLFCLISFGCYALAKIGLGLMAFKDCSEDAALLDEDIRSARADLSKRGFKFS